MNLQLVRFQFTPNSTIGKLSIDGVFFCYTLERVDDGKNTPNQSCIPEGVYPVTERWSHHFGRNVLGVDNVKDRTDIEIHIANKPSELLGCIAVGNLRDVDWIGQSEIAFQSLMQKFRTPSTITILKGQPDAQ